jgi:streptogramin lyase
VCSEDCPIGQYNQGCDGSIGYGFNCQSCTNAAIGQYYTSPGSGNSETSCARANCDTDCPIGEYRANCEFQDNPGSCEPCTSVPLGSYFTSNGGLIDDCSFEQCSVPNPNHCRVGDGNCTCSECEAGFNVFDTQGDGSTELCIATAGVCREQNTDYNEIISFTGNPVNARPLGIGVDGDGNAFICRSSGTFYRYTSTDASFQEWPTFTDDGDIITDNECLDLDVGPHFGDIYYITDTGILRVFSNSSQITTTLLTSGLGTPAGVAVDTRPLGEAKVYISDTVGNVIYEYDHATETLTTMAITGLSGPTGLAIDRPYAEALYICDTGNGVIKKYSFADASIISLPFILPSPVYVAIDMASQELFISDSSDNTVYRFNQIDNDLSGTSITSLPTAFGGFVLNTPGGVGITLTGTVIVSDSDNQRILELLCQDLVYACNSYDSSVNVAQGGVFSGSFPILGGDIISVNNIQSCIYGYTPNAVSLWDCNASTGVASSTQAFCVLDGGNCGEYESALGTLFTTSYDPYDIDVDSGYNVLFTGLDQGDGLHKVYRYDANTATISVLYTLTTTTAGGIAIDNSGTVYVTDPESGYVYIGDCISQVNGVCETYAPSLTQWSDDFTTPVAIDIDPGNNIYIVDSGSQKCLKYNERGSVLQTVIGSGVLDNPVGVVLDDQTGDLYVSDSGTLAIYKVKCNDLEANCDISENCPFRALCDASRDPAYICCPNGWAGTKTATECTLPDTVDIYNDYLDEDPPADTCIVYGGIVAHDTANSQYTCTNNVFQSCVTFSEGIVEIVSGVEAGMITSDRGGHVFFVDLNDASIRRYDSDTTQITTVLASGFTSPNGLSLGANGNLYIADTSVSTLWKYVCTGPVPTCSDGVNNGLEEDIDCGGDCPDRCQDIAADDIWFVYRDHGITTTSSSSDDYIDHGIKTLEECQGLCHNGEAPNLDGRECVGFTMATDILNWPLGALCKTYFTDFSNSQCLVRELTGTKAFLCFSAPPIYLEDYVVFEETDVTAFLYKRGDPNVYTGVTWYGLGEHQHIGDSAGDYVSLGAQSLEDCFFYCLEYDGCLGITTDYALFHEECILYLTDFSTAICQNYDQFTDRCADLYPYTNMNVVKSNTAYNAYVFDVSNYNGFIMYRTHTNGFLVGTVDTSITEASFISSVANCKLYCMKNEYCHGFRSDGTNCVIYSSYVDGTGVDAARTTSNITSAGVEHWIKYQQWNNAKCDSVLSTGAVDHGTTFKLSDCLARCETEAGCSAIEFAFSSSSCFTYTTCIGQLQSPLYNVYGNVGFLESPQCVDNSAWVTPSGTSCDTSTCLHDSIYLAYSDGSFFDGVVNDTIAPDCLDSDCCKWRCKYHSDCVASTYETYAQLFWNFDTDGYPCKTYTSFIEPRTVTAATNLSTIVANYVSINGYECDTDVEIVREDGVVGSDAGVSNVLDCQDACDSSSDCWGFTWDATSDTCSTFDIVSSTLPAHNLIGATGMLACRSSYNIDGTVPANECCSCGGGVEEYPVGIQTCVSDGRSFPAENTPLCVNYETTTPTGTILSGSAVIREDSDTDAYFWSIVPEDLVQQTAWCDRNTNWDLDLRACFSEDGVDFCGSVLHTSPGESASSDANSNTICGISASGCPSGFPYGFNLGTYCCDVETNETHQIDDPIPEDGSWSVYVNTIDVIVYNTTGSDIFATRYGKDVSFGQCGSGNYIECPQAGTYAAGDNCRNHTGYWNVPVPDTWAVVDQNGVQVNKTIDIENQIPHDLGAPESVDNTWFLSISTPTRYFFNGFRIKVGDNNIYKLHIERSRFGSEWVRINEGNFTLIDGLDSGFIYEFQDFDTFSGAYWRVVFTDMYNDGEVPQVYWVQFYTPLEKPCLVPTIPNGAWSGDGCIEEQDQVQDLTCNFGANSGYYCSFNGEFYCDAGTWLFTATSEAEDQNLNKDTDDPNGFGYGFYDGDLTNDRDGWDQFQDFSINSTIPNNVKCYPCNPYNVCDVGEYMTNCTGISPGSCGPCSNALPGEYYTSNAQYLNNCLTASCNVDCPEGEYNSGCEYTSSSGECVPCSGKLEGFYFSTDGDLTDSCVQTLCPTVENCNLTETTVTCNTATDSHCPQCNDGYWLYEDIAGPNQCRQCNNECPIGTYLRNCGNTHYPYFNILLENSKCATGFGATLLTYSIWTNATDCALLCKNQAGCTVFDNSYAYDFDTGINVPFCHLYGFCNATTVRDEIGSTVYEYVVEDKHDGTCVSCTGIPEGAYYTTTGNGIDNCQHSYCPNITNCEVITTCNANSSIMVPSSGNYNYDNFQVQFTNMRCSKCANQMFADSSTCTAETWRQNPACVAVQDLCVDCTQVTNCVSNISCTSLQDSQCTECDSDFNYYLDNENAASQCLLFEVTSFSESQFSTLFGMWAAQYNGDTYAFGPSGGNTEGFENYTVVEFADLVQGLTSIFQQESTDSSRWSWDLNTYQQSVVAEYFAQFDDPSGSVVNGEDFTYYAFNMGSDTNISAQIPNIIQNIQLTIGNDADFSDTFDFLQITSLPVNTAFASVSLYSKGSSEALLDFAQMLDNNILNTISPSDYYTVISIELFDTAGRVIDAAEVEVVSCMANALESFMAFVLDPPLATFSTSTNVIEQVGASNCYGVSGSPGVYVLLANSCDGLSPTILHGTAVCDLATQIGDSCPVVNDINYDCSGVTITCSTRGEYEISGSCTENKCLFADGTFDSTMYTVLDASCGGFELTVSHCMSSKYVACADGHNGSVTIACSTDGGSFSFSGCEESICNNFELEYGYQIFDGTCGGASSKTVSACESSAFIGCDPDTHNGTVSLTCPGSEASFKLSGCEANTCSLAATTADISTQGFQLVDTICSLPNTGTALSCTSALECADGYEGSPILKCRDTDSLFVLEGCTEVTCSWPVDLEGYDVLDTTCGGRSLTANNCDYDSYVICAEGYGGTADVSCNYIANEFSLTGCVDIDECATASHNCAINSTCINRIGTFSCTCNEGYVGTGYFCTDNDECASEASNNCDNNAICVNTEGSYSCTCSTGYQDAYSGARGKACIDVEDPILSLSIDENSLFVYFDEFFDSRDLVNECTDSAGPATVSFAGDIVNTSEIGSSTVVVICTDESGNTVTSNVTLIVGHSQVYEAFLDVSSTLIDNSALDADLTAAGLLLTCSTSVEVTNGWHPLLLVLTFNLCDLEVTDITNTIEDVFIDDIRNLNIEGANYETIIVSSVTELNANVIIVVTVEILYEELEKCRDIKCYNQQTCPQCDA